MYLPKSCSRDDVLEFDKSLWETALVTVPIYKSHSYLFFRPNKQNFHKLKNELGIPLPAYELRVTASGEENWRNDCGA